MIGQSPRHRLPALLLLAGALPSPAWADDPARAIALLDGLGSLRAVFEQQVQDESGRVTERSSGSFAMQAPDRFRWHYEEPYEQLIVADGQRVWIHDVDLEQVTVRDQAASADASPLQVLAEPATLGDRFDVSYPTARHEETLVALRPRAAAADFDEVLLRFQGDRLRSMVIEDAFGQVTRIAFDDLERNPTLDATLFTFVPPPGVDVLGLETLFEAIEPEDVPVDGLERPPLPGGR